ncbi:J domain-containing protein [Brevundimonas subvibrioides]|uniref:J domain-containing protein n=1 Tax=Brevundimonas subvibrioides TaxID=74313 RepID=UPI0022B35E58|nr:molecular chaperone DnaJ [Brevundimonas subvibrioides]
MGLIWLVLAGIVVWALVRLGRQTEGPRRGHWRVAATLVSAALLVGGALALSRGAWISGAGLVGAALWLAVASRMRNVVARPEAIGDAEARSILGVPVGAEPEVIQAAWRRLMGRAHPDQGGTEGLAAKLNAARDRLLRR